MRRVLVLVVSATTLAMTACGHEEAPPPSAAAAVVDDMVAARAALDRREWAVAVPHLRAALARDRENLFLHYQLGICASWLDQRDEAVQEFQWVLAHTPAGSDEARVAQQWLTEAGVLNPNAVADGAMPAQYGDRAVGTSGVHGTIAWAPPDQIPAPQARFQIHLIGVSGTPTSGLRYTMRTDKDGRYAFKSIIAGPYKLTDAIAGHPKWRLKVGLAPQTDVAQDLTPENGIERRDDFGGAEAKG